LNSRDFIYAPGIFVFGLARSLGFITNIFKIKL